MPSERRAVDAKRVEDPYQLADLKVNTEARCGAARLTAPPRRDAQHSKPRYEQGREVAEDEWRVAASWDEDQRLTRAAPIEILHADAVYLDEGGPRPGRGIARLRDGEGEQGSEDGQQHFAILPEGDPPRRRDCAAAASSGWKR